MSDPKGGGMGKAKPTPLPWMIGPVGYPDSIVIAHEDDIRRRLKYVATIESDWGKSPNEANAEFIVQACNSHDELLQAAKAASKHLGEISLDRLRSEGIAEDILQVTQWLTDAIANAERRE